MAQQAQQTPGIVEGAGPFRVKNLGIKAGQWDAFGGYQTFDAGDVWVQTTQFGIDANGQLYVV